MDQAETTLIDAAKHRPWWYRALHARLIEALGMIDGRVLRHRRPTGNAANASFIARSGRTGMVRHRCSARRRESWHHDCARPYPAGVRRPIDDVGNHRRIRRPHLAFGQRQATGHGAQCHAQCGSGTDASMKFHWMMLAAAITTSMAGQTLLKAGASVPNFIAQLFDPRTLAGFVLYGGIHRTLCFRRVARPGAHRWHFAHLPRRGAAGRRMNASQLQRRRMTARSVAAGAANAPYTVLAGAKSLYASARWAKSR